LNEYPIKPGEVVRGLGCLREGSIGGFRTGVAIATASSIWISSISRTSDAGGGESVEMELAISKSILLTRLTEKTSRSSGRILLALYSAEPLQITLQIRSK
jgi:hypothetical protein